MRLSPEDLYKITHLHRPKGQAAWFLEHLGVKVPCDRAGPILTPAAYEAILAKRLGVSSEQTGPSPEQRPVLHLRDEKKPATP